MIIDELSLELGIDIPFLEAGVTIHQPRLKEIAYVTEHRFWLGCQLLKFDKENLTEQDKNSLSNWSNFNIIMSMIQEKNMESQQAKLNVLSILTLLFPNYTINLGIKAIQLQHSQTKEIAVINNNNFEKFKDIINEMFCLKGGDDKQYNPAGDLAKKLADKFKKARAKRAQLASGGRDNENISILGRYVSILTVGQKKDMNSFQDYTVYQLMDEFSRFNLKLQYDAWVKYKIAGAQDLQTPEDWLKDMHDKVKDNSSQGWSEFISY